jgi:hypothetical protein
VRLSCLFPFFIFNSFQFIIPFSLLSYSLSVRPLHFSRIFLFLPSISSSFFRSIYILHYFLSPLPILHSSLHLVSSFFPFFWLPFAVRGCILPHTVEAAPHPPKNNTSTDFLDGFFLNFHGLAWQNSLPTTHERDPHLSLSTKLNYPSVPYHSYGDPIIIYIYIYIYIYLCVPLHWPRAHSCCRHTGLWNPRLF